MSDSVHTIVAALFVETNGRYFGVPGVDPWDEPRDARTYVGPYPVVAHPPCFLWVNMAGVNWKRYKRQKPAWYPGGTDGGCFESALASVRKYGGVLEHPAFSHAWKHFDLRAPMQWTSPQDVNVGWALHRQEGNGLYSWVCEVWQSAYGHKARKRTWLYYVGRERPQELNWSRRPGSHQVGWFDRIKPTLSKKEASATPAEFAAQLLQLAASATAVPTTTLTQGVAL